MIEINQTAAGYNWYVNASPRSGQAFGLAGPGGEKLAGPGSPAAAQVDLLTVLEHELGHVIGLADNNQAGNLMDTTLGLGARRAPTAAEVTTAVHTLSSINPPAFKATLDAALDSLASDFVRLKSGRHENRSLVSPAHPDGRITSSIRQNIRRLGQSPPPGRSSPAKNQGD